MTQTERRPETPAQHTQLEQDIRTVTDPWSSRARTEPLHVAIGLALTLPKFLFSLLIRPRKRTTWKDVRRKLEFRLVPYPLAKLRKQFDFVPQAIISKPISNLSELAVNQVDVGSDNLDQYEGFGFVLAGKIPVVLMHYNGHPENTSTIYLPRGITDLEQITRLIQIIVRSFGLSSDVIEWQRKDDPDL